MSLHISHFNSSSHTVCICFTRTVSLHAWKSILNLSTNEKRTESTLDWNEMHARDMFIFSYKYCTFYFTVKLHSQHKTVWKHDRNHVKESSSRDTSSPSSHGSSAVRPLRCWRSRLIITSNHRPRPSEWMKIASCSPYWNCLVEDWLSLSYCVALNWLLDFSEFNRTNT